MTEAAKESLGALEARLREAARSAPQGIWVHAKSQNNYEVTGAALRESDLEPLVIYRPLGDSNVVTFARPLVEFLEKFTRWGR